MAISFGDNVRVADTPLTASLGLAGLTGVVHGETTPSVTGVEVIGDLISDYAFNVVFDGRDDALWFAAELLEFIDHAPGTVIRIGDKQFNRKADGEWISAPPTKQRPWWKFW
jgi:hypothetical protein